jgi:hypothetical protein
LWQWNEEQTSWSDGFYDLDLKAELPTLLIPLDLLVMLPKLSSSKEGVIFITSLGHRRKTRRI